MHALGPSSCHYSEKLRALKRPFPLFFLFRIQPSNKSFIDNRKQEVMGPSLSVDDFFVELLLEEFNGQ